MVSICFSSFALGVVFIFLCLRDSVAYTHQVMETLVVADGSPLNFDKEVFNAVPTSVEAKNRRFGSGGRKMTEKMVMKKEMVNLGKRKLNVEHKLSNTSPPPVNVKKLGFVALNADYHVPKSHPPKNN
ncbi:hypothetical protein F0562_023515 [Nyssa sinensis]|uniref:Uncharacterized protein n=1 Tax=Nyssa sinensis TaxID=561372 RepID=A0A5J5BHY0_9ASTE|nr:hypothetical protein F0562_023515 [Nyssa sinensis]